MKGILMFDNLSDLVYFDVDDDLSQHIQKLAFKDGLLESTFSENNAEKMDKNAVMQIFSPLIASYRVMQAQFGNKYKYIESVDEVLLVFDEILNHVIINVCKKDTLEDAYKELSIFIVIVEMLFGSSLHLMKREFMSCCKEFTRYDLISNILSKWKTLKNEQQMYLVEAIERLIINQDITAMVINLLQEMLEKLRNAHKESTFCHSFVLVDCKLLALYSSRNSGQISKEVLLLLILVAQVLKRNINTSEKSQDNADDEFFIPISSSVVQTNQSNEKIKLKSSAKTKDTKNEEKYDKLKNGSHSLLVFIKSRTGTLVPHILYVIEITHKVTIVFLNELTTYGVVSSGTAHLIKRINNLMHHPLIRHPIGSFESFQTEFKNLVDSIYKMKCASDKEKNLKKLVTKWEQLKQNEFEQFFLSPKSKLTNPRLESGLSSCCDILKEFFEECIAIPCLQHEENTRTDDHQEILKILQRLSIRRLIDVADFLEVKAIQNVTMASYITEYPGLVHFIYVDRNTDCLIAPNIILKKGHLSGTTSLRQKIWKMVSLGRKYIDGVNNYCCLWKYEDLYFFYYIWFEDSTGRVIKPTCYPRLKNFPGKGILCGNFYKKLVKECFPNASIDHISCYEFFCVHLGSTSTEAIVDQSQKLCAQLWDFSGAYRTSLDLLC